MKIIFDATTLSLLNGSITGVVYFDFDDKDRFPMDGWNDFVVVVACWWLDAFYQLSSGSEMVTLRFMDGPYFITATAENPRTIIMRCIEDRAGAGIVHESRVSMNDLERILLRFSRAVLHSCVKAGIVSKDLGDLIRKLQHSKIAKSTK
jgi:hypothetical protein